MREKVWVDLKAVDKIVGDPPCREGGVDCTERYPGCSGKCERFAAWKEKRLKARETYFKDCGGDLATEKYVMQSYRKMQKFKGKVVKER